MKKGFDFAETGFNIYVKFDQTLRFDNGSNLENFDVFLSSKLEVLTVYLCYPLYRFTVFACFKTPVENRASKCVQCDTVRYFG